MLDDFSHQIRQVAGPIKLNAELLRERLVGIESDPAIRTAIDTIEKKADKLLSGVRDLASALEPTIFELDPMIRGLWRTLRAERLDLQVTYRSTLRSPVHIHAVRPFVASAIKNVIDNAVEAMEEKGHLEIILRGHPGRRDLVDLQITDSGPGVNTTELERVWEYKYSTKPMGQGYGLWRTRQVMEQLGGRAVIDGSGSKGTTVVLTLPRVGSRHAA